MSDPLSHVQPGDPLAIPASGWNQIVDLVRAKNGAGGPGALPANLERPALVVRVQASGTLPNRAIVTLGDALIDPDTDPLEAARTPLFECTAPVSGDVPAVLLAGLSSGEIGRAVVQGVCVASVVISDGSHTHAVPVVGDTSSLESATSGAFRLLTNPGVGLAKCLVMLGPEPPAASLAEARWLFPVRAATTGNIDTATTNAGSVIDGVTLAAGDYVLLKNQTTQTLEGIWLVNDSGGLTRATGLASYSATTGVLIAVREGTTNAATVWIGTGNSLDSYRRMGEYNGTGTANNVPTFTGTREGLQESSTFANAVGELTTYETPTDTASGDPFTQLLSGVHAGVFGEDGGSGQSVVKIALAATGSGWDTGGLYLSCPAAPVAAYGSSLNMIVEEHPVDSLSANRLMLSVKGFVASQYFVSPGTGTREGYTGTLSDGTECVGGLVVDVGAGGSYVTEGGDNAFTGENSFADTTTHTGPLFSQNAATFTPEEAAAVPVTVQGAASQSANLSEWKNSGGTVLASVSAAGALTGASLNGPYDGGTW